MACKFDPSKFEIKGTIELGTPQLPCSDRCVIAPTLEEAIELARRFGAENNIWAKKLNGEWHVYY